MISGPPTCLTVLCLVFSGHADKAKPGRLRNIRTGILLGSFVSSMRIARPRGFLKSQFFQTIPDAGMDFAFKVNDHPAWVKNLSIIVDRHGAGITVAGGGGGARMKNQSGVVLNVMATAMSWALVRWECPSSRAKQASAQRLSSVSEIASRQQPKGGRL